MSLTRLIQHIVNGLWALGGIGAAADLGLEQTGAAWDEPCPCRASRKGLDAASARERHG